ncbi:MAG: glyoxalase [Winogradskyella sp.]
MGNIKSIRPFIGSKNYTISRKFYLDLGFEELKTSKKMSYFKIGDFGFYLQDYFIKDWVNNSMLFLEVENIEAELKKIKALNLTENYKNVKLSEIINNDWGSEFFLHDPSGILWHIGKFN